MATRTSLPSALNVNVADDVAIREGEQAATRIVRGAHLTDQLKVGVALMALSRIALTQAGANARMGRPYNEAFSRQLAKHPKLEAVYGHTRAAALWCVENWADTQAYLARLEKEDPVKLQLLGARGLRKAIEEEIATAHRAAEALDRQNEPLQEREPVLTPAQKLGVIARDLRQAGMRWDEANGLSVEDFRSLADWTKARREWAMKNAAADDDDKPNSSGPATRQSAIAAPRPLLMGRYKGTQTPGLRLRVAGLDGFCRCEAPVARITP